MSNLDVKKNLLDHSGAKVRLLGEYLKRYLNIIANDGYTSRIRIYDLFCGEGLYENGGEGSPLVIMRHVKDLHFVNVAKNNSIPKVDFHFNDIDSEKVQKVERVLNEKSLYYTEFGTLSNSSVDYQEISQLLVQKLPALKQKNEKAFVFIDPYEYKHIRASHIKELMKSGNAEVLLWLPTQFMYRFATNGTPEALKDFILELLPDFSQSQPGNVWDFIQQLKFGFQSFLGDRFFVDNFTIQKDPATVFCLFFFTAHIRGFEKMLETKWDIDTEHGRGWDYAGNQQTLFHDQKINLLEEKLERYLYGSERFNTELYEFTLRSGFLPKHANEIFYNWQSSQKLDVLTYQRTKGRKNAFYIDYKHYKAEDKKAIFILR